MWDWDWSREDIQVHVACGGKEGMLVSQYAAAVAVAMVSFFTGRWGPCMDGAGVGGGATNHVVLLCCVAGGRWRARP